MHTRAWVVNGSPLRGAPRRRCGEPPGGEGGPPLPPRLQVAVVVVVAVGVAMVGVVVVRSLLLRSLLLRSLSLRSLLLRSLKEPYKAL